MLLAAFALSAPAQIVGGEWNTRFTHAGTLPSTNFGACVAGGADVNNDGFDDYAVGAPSEAPGGLVQAGAVYVFSGVDNSLLWKFDGTIAGGNFGFRVSLPADFDQDGHVDIAASAPFADPNGLFESGYVEVYSGATGALMNRVEGLRQGDKAGFSIDGGGDIDDDGVPDFLIGSIQAQVSGVFQAGRVMAISGADWSLIHNIGGKDVHGELGASVADLGDINGDGHADFAAGAPTETPLNNEFHAGHLYVFSGADGSELLKIAGIKAIGHLGSFADGMGDMNGDGVPDILSSAPGADVPGIARAGEVYVFSGLDGSVLGLFRGFEANQGFGETLANAGDLNNDGFDEMIVGSRKATLGVDDELGYLAVYSGADGSLFYWAQGFVKNDNFAAWATTSGDTDGDGHIGILVGAPGMGGPQDFGVAIAEDFDPFVTVNSREISAAAAPTIQYLLDFPQSEGNMNYVLLLSGAGPGPDTWRGITIPLTKDGLFNNSENNSYPPGFLGGQGVLGGNGNAFAEFPATSQQLSGVIGNQYWAAAITHDFAQIRGVSAAAVVRIVP